MSTVNVACKLPQGITIRHKNITKTLRGANSSGNRFGYGVTQGIDADWFKDWAEGDAKDFPPVKKGMIFALEGTVRKIEDAAAERRGDAEVQTGIEPLDPDAPAPEIEPTDDTKKALSENPVTDTKAANASAAKPK